MIMKHFIGGLIILIGWIMSIFVLAMQIAYFLSFQYDIASYRVNCHFVWDPSILWWQGNDQYFHLVIVIIGLGSLLLILRMLMPGKNDRQKKAAKRHMTKEEHLMYSHLASRHEVKKGLQRIRFNSNGDIVHKRFTKIEVHIGQFLTLCGIVCMIWIVVKLIKAIADLASSHGQKLFNCSVAVLPALLLVNIMVIWLLCAKFHFRDYCDQIYDQPKRAWN